MKKIPLSKSTKQSSEKEHDSAVGSEFNDKLCEPLTYWRDQLEDAPFFSTLITDRPRSANNNIYPAIINYEFNAALIERFNNIIKPSKTELFVALFSAFAILLSRYTGEEDCIIGIESDHKKPSSSQNSHYLSASILPLKIKINPNDSFINLLGQIKKARAEANLHSHINMNHIIHELKIPTNLSYHPLFQIMVIMHHYENDPIPRSEPIYATEQCAPLDLILQLTSSNTKLKGCFSYNANLYEKESIEQFISHFKNLLSCITTNPHAPLSNLSVLDTPEREQVLYTWNSDLIDETNIVHISTQFEAQAVNTPNQVAVFCDNEQITFSELNQRANQLAHYLRTKGVDSNVCIAVAMLRSIDLIITLIGIVKSGGAYFLINEKLPMIKAKEMLDEIKPMLLIYSDEVAEKNEWLTQNTINVQSIHFKNLATNNNFANTNLKNSNNLKDLFYIIYTSGSTGKPKAVMGTYLGMANRLNELWTKYPYNTNERCCQKTSLSFVDHVAEIFSPLLKGIPLYFLSDAAAQGDLNALCQDLIKNSITRITMVPSLLKLFLLYLDEKKMSIPTLTHIISSGEALPINTCISFYQLFPNGILINLYGSSEVSGDAACMEIKIKDLYKVMPYFKKGLSDVDKYLSTSNSQNKLIQSELVEFFQKFQISDAPVALNSYQELLNKYVIPNIVNVSSPSFIGHMTSVLPSFNHTFYQLMSALNQNVVKIETSKALTFLEREAIAMMHHAFYSKEALFYKNTMQNPNKNLGLVTSGGTQANITALWVARNNILKPHNEFGGVAAEGMTHSLAYYGYKDIVLFISPLLHYSINKAASLLGIGTNNIRLIPISKSGKLDFKHLRQEIKKLKSNHYCVMAIVGIAGATETGSIDPLYTLSEIAREHETHLHVDGAFGGPFIFSDTHRHKLKGIEHADSITICGHKQLYLPLGLSLCLFKNPDALASIYITTDYQATKTGFDFGKASSEGSRPALSLLLHANLNLLGKAGYSDILDENVKKAFRLKELIEINAAFELLWEPEINIVNYRYIPNKYRKATRSQTLTINDNKEIDAANILLQKIQFENGNTFISKTSIPYLKGSGEIISLRAVIANPLSTEEDIIKNLEEQLTIANQYIELKNQNDPVLLISNINNSLSFEKTFAPIGKPLGNCQAYILDKYLHPVGVGMPGELYISGMGLAKGYLNQEDLTAKTFIQNPFAREAGTKMYKTGDICRWLSDGNIEYLGRKDSQVKVRGYRIELGEVEQVINQHDCIKDCIVTLREDPLHNKCLVAYIIPMNDPISNEALRIYLSERLVDYTIPSAFVWLDSFPMTQSGKINRNILPSPDWAKRQHKGTLPQDSIEEMLAELWKTLLHVPDICLEDDFFDLGGDSLAIIKMLTKLEQKITYPISIGAFNKKRTLLEFANTVREHVVISNNKNNNLSPDSNISTSEIKSTQGGKAYLSMAQVDFINLDQLRSLLNMPSLLSVVPCVLRFKGPLNIQVLQKSILNIVERHGLLKYRYPSPPSKKHRLIQYTVSTILSIPRIHHYLIQKDAKKYVFNVWKKGFKALDWNKDNKTYINKEHLKLKAIEINQFLHRDNFLNWLNDYDRDKNSIIKTKLIKNNEDEYLLLIALDHLIADGYSINIFIDELLYFYSIQTSKNTSLLKLPDLMYNQQQYNADDQYSLSEEQFEFWKENYRKTYQFQRQQLPIYLKKWSDNNKKTTSSHKIHNLSNKAIQKIRTLSKKLSTSPYITVLSYLCLSLSDQLGLETIAISTPVANRTPLNYNSIGYFANVMNLAFDVTTNTLNELIQSVDKNFNQGLKNQDIPWAWMRSKMAMALKNEPMPNNFLLVPVILFDQRSLRDTEVFSNDISVEEYYPPDVESEFLQFKLIEKGGQYSIAVYSDPQIYDSEQVEKIFTHLVNEIEL